MHTFPNDEAMFLQLVGDSIAQVWLDPNGVRLLFGSKASLYAEHKIEQTEPSGIVWIYNCQALSETAIVLHRLLYKSILAIKREDLRLTFAFEDGASLSVLSELGPYESGNFSTRTGSLVAF
jgi:hypothetical protein